MEEVEVIVPPTKRLEAMRVLPWTAKRAPGEEVPIPSLVLAVSKVKRLFPIFQALGAVARVVVAEPAKAIVKGEVKLRPAGWV